MLRAVYNVHPPQPASLPVCHYRKMINVFCSIRSFDDNRHAPNPLYEHRPKSFQLHPYRHHHCKLWPHRNPHSCVVVRMLSTRCAFVFGLANMTSICGWEFETLISCVCNKLHKMTVSEIWALSSHNVMQHRFGTISKIKRTMNRKQSLRN